MIQQIPSQTFNILPGGSQESVNRSGALYGIVGQVFGVQIAAPWTQESRPSNPRLLSNVERLSAFLLGPQREGRVGRTALYQSTAQFRGGD